LEEKGKKQTAISQHSEDLHRHPDVEGVEGGPHRNEEGGGVLDVGLREGAVHEVLVRHHHPVGLHVPGIPNGNRSQRTQTRVRPLPKKRFEGLAWEGVRGTPQRIGGLELLGVGRNALEGTLGDIPTFENTTAP